MAAAILQACGLTVGTYSSPHLERINERLEFAGVEISDDAFVEVLGTLAELERFLGLRATWFELVTAAAYAWFADMAAEAAVVEVGLGGRYDATNVADADVAVVTNVELDHTDILGHTRESIAGEKAGILKKGSLLVLGEQEPVVASIFEAEARRVGARAIWRRGHRVRLRLQPARSRRPGGRPLDAARAVLRGAPAASRRTSGETTPPARSPPRRPSSRRRSRRISSATPSPRVTVPGRLEVVRRHPLVVLDGAHNPAGAAAAGRALKEDFAAARRVVVVMGCLRGRDPGELLSALGT